ncbi:MAG: 3-oxoadipate enol-lactonase [Methylobacteriaceae bacterium]|nr:3-oxoadipate enol-lactonase [Methylobacteriaceae bacterium]
MPMIRTANGTELFHLLEGPEDAPVVAFSNSLGTTHRMWDAQAAALSSAFRCLRYDTRGHGRSPVVETAFEVEDLADDLAGLLDALGISRAHVVGLSLGGMTGQALAFRRPELVDRLVLVATSAYLPPAELWRERAAIVRDKGMGAIVGNVIARWFLPPHQTSLGAEETRRILVEEIAAEGYARCCEAIGRMDLRARIGAIRAPTLVVSGEGDPATPVAMGEEIHRLVPGSTFVVVRDAAHLVAVEQAAALNGHLAAFLDPAEPDGPGAQVRRPTPTPEGDGRAYAAGLENRREVLGAPHVERSLAGAGAFAAPWQDFITRYAWGEIWGDGTLPWKSRSIVTLAITLALGREEEFKLHLRPALRNGVTPDELRALLKQVAVYAGVPAANAGFRWARETLGDELG